MRDKFTKNINDLINFCIDYTLYMKEHNFSEKEINKLKRRRERFE